MAKPYEVEIQGDDESRRAFNSAKKSIDGIERALGKAGQAGSGVSAIFKGMTLSRAAVDLAYQMADAIKRVVQAGFQYNQTIEQSTLGIASIVASSTTLVSQEGKLLKGREALNASMKLSADLVKQIEIRGLQTTATTEQLVEAFQNAVGPATSMGLSLAQTRDITLDIIQAAGALGIPMHQLNEEVRSIVGGTINIQSRVAQALGLTNEMVKDWAEQGTLAANLTKKLEVFRLAGDETANTWSGLTSNMEEAISKISGTLTRDIFDDLKRAFKGVLEDLIIVNEQGVKLAPWVDEAREYVNRLYEMFKDTLETVWDLGGRGGLQAIAGIMDVILAVTEKIVKGWKLISESYVGEIASETLAAIGEGWSHIAGLIREGSDYLDRFDENGNKVKQSTEQVAQSVEEMVQVYGKLSEQKVEAYRKAYRKTLDYLEREVTNVKNLEQKKIDLIQKTNDIKKSLHDQELARQRETEDFDAEEKRLKRELAVLKGYKQPLTEQEQKKAKIADTEKKLKRLQEDRAAAEADYTAKVEKAKEELQKLENTGKTVADQLGKSKSNVELLNKALKESSGGALTFNADLSKSVATSNQLATNLLAAGKAIVEFNQNLPDSIKEEKLFKFEALEKELQAPMAAAKESATQTETAVKNINTQGSVQQKQLQANKAEWERINELADEHEAKIRRIQLAMRDWNFQMEGVTDQAGAYSPGY